MRSADYGLELIGLGVIRPGSLDLPFSVLSLCSYALVTNKATYRSRPLVVLLVGLPSEY